MNLSPQIIPERLAKITVLDDGGHDSFEAGVCAMEAASYIAGEPFSDHPQCVCPVIGAFMRSWNDGLPDDERTDILLPLIPLTIGTRGSDALAERRSLMAADWLVRTHTVAWLRLAKLDKQADLLVSLPEITSMAQVPSIRAPLEAVRSDAAVARAAAGAVARAAAGAAARDAAWDAAWDAARAAAQDAARAAAWAAAQDAAQDAAWDAARAAARAAAWAAAQDAAQDAARDALKDTKKELQVSAADLVKRMCALTEADLKAAA